MAAEAKERVRLAFVGCGAHSSKTLQPNARMVEQIDLIAMCDLDDAKARRAAGRWGALPYTDYGRMLKEQELDAVVVVGPPAMMQPITKDILARGVHVLTEKPPALTAALAKELVDVSESSGALGMVATHWRHAQAYAKARDLMADSAFGEPSHCHGWFFAPGPLRAGETPEDLGGYLLFQGVHLVDCTRALMGDVAELSASERAADGIADSFSVSMRFASRATGTLSMAAHAPYWTGHRIFGTAGAFVEVENGRRLCCALPPYWTGQEHMNYTDHAFATWDTGPYRVGNTGSGYQEELTHFAQCVLQGKQPVASLRDGYEAMRTLEAIRHSIVTGQPVSLR